MTNMADKCDICGGRKYITLPTRLNMGLPESLDLAKVKMASSRTYPCPECAPKVPEGHVAILCVSTKVDVRWDREEMLEGAKGDIVRMLVDRLSREGYVTFERLPSSAQEMAFEIRGVLGAIAPVAVACMEERIAQHQEVLAREVIETAVADISNWGSNYSENTGHISRAKAIEFVRASLQNTLKRRKNTMKV